MKTQGIEVHHGYLVHRGTNDIPEPFWARLCHEASKRQILDDLREAYGAWAKEPKGSRRIMAEHAAFRVWVERLVGEPPAWPWESGWTEAMVDAWPKHAARDAA